MYLNESINGDQQKANIDFCAKHHIVIPTFEQLKNPESIPDAIKHQLSSISIDSAHPLNLFRINWRNDSNSHLFGDVNYVEIPQTLTGVNARIVALVGKSFPTESHKVGSAFTCLLPYLVSGKFDLMRDTLVWPSSGNFCRGGVFVTDILGCDSVAFVFKNTSLERNQWLQAKNIPSVVLEGKENLMKEICDEINRYEKMPHHLVLNQFEIFGNPVFHYHVTGSAIEECYCHHFQVDHSHLAAFVSSTGSAGTIAAGDYLKTKFPQIKIVASEALQCPTLMMNGCGVHRIEGISDRHIPWVHNIRNLDAVVAIDDADCLRLLRLFNEKKGRDFLKEMGVDARTLTNLDLLGISGIANLLSAIKTAKYFELGSDDVIFTVFTDSMDMYQSRLREQKTSQGEYSILQAAQDFSASLHHQGIDYFKELSHYERKAIHNLKFFTWVQQGNKDIAELNEQWKLNYWHHIFLEEANLLDQQIQAFNTEVSRKISELNNAEQ